MDGCGIHGGRWFVCCLWQALSSWQDTHRWTM